MKKILAFIMLVLLSASIYAKPNNKISCDSEEGRDKYFFEVTVSEKEKSEYMKGNLEFSPFSNEIAEQNLKLIKEGSSPEIKNPKEIMWVEARRLILAGHIHYISQSHNQTVLLVSKLGHSYRTKEPEIDSIYQIVSIVDPCGVFISVATE